MNRSNRKLLAIGSIFFIAFAITLVLVFLHVTETLDANIALTIYDANLGQIGTAILIGFSQYGREYFWSAILLVMLLLGSKETKLLAIELGVLFLFGIISGEILKAILYRPRPFLTINGIIPLIPEDSDSSFPSGHALIVAIGATFAFVKFHKKLLATLLGIEATIVCFSRIYLGLHYPLDVLAGILWGVAIVFIGISVMDRYYSQYFDTVTKFLTKILKDGPLKV